MTTLTASDIAARRIREARAKRGWRVKDLADACKKAGAPHLTAAVITNLETRRRPGREITADELVTLAWILGVPPIQLLSPLNGDEALQIVPGEERDPLEAVAWLGDDDTALLAIRYALSEEGRDTERVLRYRGSPVTALRQIRTAARQIRWHEEFLSAPEWAPETPAEHKNTLAMHAIRLLHLLAALEADGYERPPLGDIPEILARHRIPASLAEWDKKEERDGSGA